MKTLFSSKIIANWVPIVVQTQHKYGTHMRKMDEERRTRQSTQGTCQPQHDDHSSKASTYLCNGRRVFKTPSNVTIHNHTL